MRPVMVVVVFVVFLGLSAGSAVQQPPGMPSPGPPGSQGQVTPPRAGSPGPGETPATGTAILRGFVVAADTGEPVRRAIVRVMAPGSGGVTSTDEDGRFEMRDLPAGRYSLSASKGGYVSVQYGQRQPRQAGTPIELRDGEVVEKIQLVLPPGSVITGRLFDDFGDPVSGVMVSALEYRSMGGRRQLVAAAAGGSRSTTDDQGSFRLYGLAPGDYYVAASPPSMMQAPGMRDDTPSAAPTYYPGTMNSTEAALVRVQLGRETAGISFPLVIARMASVSGQVVNAQGERASNVMVMVTPAQGGFGALGMPRGRQVDRDGTFIVNNVPPGDYVLQARAMGSMGPGSDAARLPLSVGTGDVDGLLLTMLPGGIARGRVVLEAYGTTSLDPSSTAVNFASPEPGIMITGSPIVQVDSDWTFEATGLFEPRIVRGGARSPDWMLKAVRLNGRDVTDQPIEFGPGRTVDDIEVVLTDRVTSVEGMVTDDRGQPVDATILVFSGDPAHWTQFLSRYVRTTRPDLSGRYEFRLLPPHRDYRLVAVTNVADDDLRDPEFLASVRDAAVRFSLAEGERRVENLRVRPD